MVNSGDTRAIRGRLPVLRSALAVAATLGAVFLLCWSGAAIGWLSASHMYVAIFTVEPAGSVAALATGLCWSLAFGTLVGALLALAYNALSFLER